ncbi:hypothetical protein HYPSUDRAFT_37405 [Hypholoma sublateritium FD-334 SS-4]|uniref:Uncharacterized protein n=1 Tax=Hypholoma sublateritium (strain FD-334 SS-4) TaxID=945553 RepID=A0A0D2Q1L0_HYPSF|nr:hypothetical protein HYPSUDRAFT_37405 [Hypholoma sublateritium FD-334 SS-4]
MSPQRVADAASISPYPFVVRQERQPPPQPPAQPPAAQSSAHESARPAKGKKKPKPPRPAEEEIRFNTGPRTLRAPVPARAPRRGFRFGRAGPEDERGIPDYPPPSFQEAISTPPLSVSPSAVSLVPTAATRPVPDVPALPPQEPDPPTTAAAGADPGGPAETDDTASVSDESIFIIERNSVPFSSTDLPSGAELTRRVHRDWLSRRGVEFPGLPPSQQEAAAGSNRGRAVAQVKPPLLALDTGTKLDLHEGVSPPPASPKRRFLTLSPLRTMFEPKSPVHEARAMSAHPAPGGSVSPYAASRSTFFRSTSSLATSLLPLLPAHKSGSLSRRIFAHRGKVKPLGPPEQLDAWEVLEEETYQGIDVDGATHPASLMSAIAAMRPLIDVGASPTRSQSFTFGAQPHTAPASTRAHHQFTLSQEFGIDGPTASPVRDWKGPSTAFIDRPLNRRTGASPSMLSVVPVTATHPNASTSVIDLPLVPPSSSGVLEPVRLRPAAASPPPSLAYKRTAHVVHASPLRVEAQPRIFIGNPETGTALYQRALETPLPVTPLLRTEFDDEAANGGHGPGADIRSDIDAPFLSRTSPQLSLAVHHRLATAASASAINLLDEPMTPTRHHYAGRPLPRPPSMTRVGALECSTAQAPSCPEGLLIDLDDTTLDDSPSGASTPRSEYSRGGLFPPRPAMSQSTSSVDLIGDTAQSAHDMFSDLTDLDLLVAGLSERPQDGSDYDVSLSPARPASHARGLTAAPADAAPPFRVHRAREPAAWDGIGAIPAPRALPGGHRAH